MYVVNTTKEIKMKNYFDILKKTALFGSFEDNELEKILICLQAKTKTYDKHEVIFEQGTHAKHLGIVLSGSIQINKIDYFGNKTIVAKVGQGKIFAESFACADTKSLPVNVISNEKSEIMLIECSKIISTCQNSCNFHNRLIYNLLHIVSDKNLLLNQKVEILSQRTTKEKLVVYLLDQAKENNSNEFTIPFDRQGLADFLSVERSAMAAEIGKLRDEGFLETNKSFFKLL